MKIAAASLQMAASHQASFQHEVSDSLRVWRNRDQGNSGAHPAPAATPSAAVHLSAAAKATQCLGPDMTDPSGASAESDPRFNLIRLVVEMLTGKKIAVFDASSLQTDAPTELSSPPPDTAAAPAADPQTAAGWGVDYRHHESVTETEETSFAATGTVKTSDGKEIQFSLSFSLARSFHQESDTRIQLGDAARQKDPLVININGTAAQLTDTRFSFDIDADGLADNINFVAPGSGFLALDRNNDGKINDGSELFGAASGNGFAELASLDSDHNGWIDDNDPAYKDLKVWTRDAEGKDQLTSLADANVGAVAASSVATPFALKDNSNGLAGQLRATGIFLRESGEAGTIQKIDLTA